MEVLWQSCIAGKITTITSARRATSKEVGDGLRDAGGGPTFTWILMGRGIPSFRSLVLSLKSLQNWPMGIPLWVGDKHTHKNKAGEK